MKTSEKLKELLVRVAVFIIAVHILNIIQARVLYNHHVKAGSKWKAFVSSPIDYIKCRGRLAK